MKTYVLGQIRGDQALKTLYEQMYAFAEEFSGNIKIRTYSCHMQAFMAASMIHQVERGKMRVCRADPGQGKTIVMVLIAKWMQTHRPGTKVCIAASTPHIVAQLTSETGLFKTYAGMNFQVMSTS